jgi:bacillithiol system protein YtxJ
MYKTIGDVEQVIKESEGKRVLVFKHSSTCPISASAKRQVDSFLKKNHGISAYLLVVQKERPISNELEKRLEVVHESPQLLILKDGRAEVVLNHYQISQETIAKGVGD